MKLKGTKNYELTISDAVEIIVQSEGNYREACQDFNGDERTFRRLIRKRGIIRSWLPDGTLVIEHRKGSMK